MSLKLFITGTDTDAGKTYISSGLLNIFNRQGLSTIGIKPVASGCREINGKLYNDDALTLLEASSIKLDYDKINPFAFAPPIAPHVAAKLAHQELTVDAVNQQIQFALNYSADICLIEGAGGWFTPLNHHETLAGLVKINGFSVVLVVGMKLGCINHALLTMNTLRNDGIQMVGWVANCIDPDMAYREESITTLQKMLPAPCLGVVPYNVKPETVLDIPIKRFTSS